MIFYFLIFLIISFFSFLEILGQLNSIKSSVFLIISFVLFCLSFLRWETGTDWSTYIDFFNNSDVFFQQSDFEWGFSRLNEIVRILFNNYTILLFFIAIILFSFQSKAILKLSPLPITSLLVLWSTTFANVFFIRQSLSTVILFYSIKYIQTKKVIPFVICILLASMFHRTSIIFIFAWFVYHLNIKNSVMIVSIVFSIFLASLISYILDSFGNVLGGVIEHKISFYIGDNSNTMGSNLSLTEIMLKGFINKLFIFSTCLIFLTKKKFDKKYNGYINLFWLGIIIYFSTISISIALIRFSFPFDITAIILIPLIMKNIENINYRLLLFTFFFVYLGVRHYSVIVGNYYDSYVPYKTIFSF
jgi:hypothetical protein